MSDPLQNSYDISRIRVTAKSLAVDLLSTMAPRHAVAVGELVRAGALFGIGENSMRVSLARLRAEGIVESDVRGSYRLSGEALPVNRVVRSWASVEDSVGPWDGSWIAVETSGLPRRDRRGTRVRERALRLLGFEALTPALRVRPNNWVGGVEACRERLSVLGYVPAPLVFQLASLDDATLERARALWNIPELEAAYDASRERLAASAQRLPALSSEAAMAESFLLGGEAMRQIVLDPLLPGEIVNVAARHALIEEMRRYDRMGREAWKQWARAAVERASSPKGSAGRAPIRKLSTAAGRA